MTVEKKQRVANKNCNGNKCIQDDQESSLLVTLSEPNLQASQNNKK